MPRTAFDVKLACIAIISLYAPYIVLIHRAYHLNLQQPDLILFWFLSLNQILILTTALFIISTCSISKLVQTFNLIAVLTFCVQSQIQVTIFHTVGFGNLLKFPNKLMTFVYFYRVLKHVLLLTQVQSSYE
ncbi:Hypothetical_protein [Hexamita inflata]|uniref:Hypothetical_protein n=1 Tax=Hexamita inflata TaxID=28002 RepID=A0AA86TPU2_9EUKA|nr:Hypothetical protein HINF_LOCUS12719 [Hexamita inflata]